METNEGVGMAFLPVLITNGLEENARIPSTVELRKEVRRLMASIRNPPKSLPNGEKVVKLAMESNWEVGTVEPLPEWIWPLAEETVPNSGTGKALFFSFLV